MNNGYQHGVMLLLLAGGAAVWLLAVLAVLSLCRAAANADAQDVGRRKLHAGRARATVGLAAAAAAVSAASDDATAVPGPCPNSDVPYTEAPVAVRDALACEIDRVRVRHGLRELRGDGRLHLAARRHSADMVRRGYFSHVTPSGTDLGERVRRTGYATGRCGWRVGEVLAWGVRRRSTASATVRAWLRSSGHRAIVLSRAYAEVGIGTRGGTPPGYRSGVTVTAVLGRRHC